MNIRKFVPLFTAAGLAFYPAVARDVITTTTPSANLALARQLNQAFVQVADEVSPAVVVITVIQKPNSTHTPESQDDDDDPLDNFRRFLQQQQQDPQAQSQPQVPERSTGQGSGIIIRGNGYILTNRHVVEDAETIEVRLKDGRVFKNAVVRGVDAPADVAVIKIDAEDLPVAKLADSDKTRVGEFAVAIGAPFALDYSVTFGHVSAKDRSNVLTPDSSSAMMDQNFIQTDANINPGNSGGPLVNIEGEVIGINTLIRGLHTGIGFAIPINLAREIADKIIANGKFTRSWLGVGIKSLREYPEYSNLIKSVHDGVVVQEIVPKGPAADSDLRPADVITAIDGKPIITSQQLKDEIRSKKIGSAVALEVVRKTRDGEKKLSITVKPGEWVDKTESVTDDGSGENGKNPLGFSVKAMTPELARKYNIDMAEGVIITSIDKSGIAAENGILEGDIITSIDERPITNPRQFHDALRHVNTKKGTIIQLISSGTAKFEVLKEAAE